MAMTLADLNRMKREVAISGAAGTSDIPFLYELLLQGQEAPQLDLAPPPALPEEEPGSDLAFDYFGSPGAEASALGLGAAPASVAARRQTGEGRGESAALSAASPTTGLAQSYSPELEAFLDDYLGALKDPTLIGQMAPGVGLAMDLSTALQEEDYLGAVGSLAQAAAPLGMSLLGAAAAGVPVDPSQIGQLTLRSLTDVTPLDMAGDIVGRSMDLGTSLRSVASEDLPFSTDTPVTEGYSLSGVPAAVEEELDAALQFALENQPAPPGSRDYSGPLGRQLAEMGASKGLQQAVRADLGPADVSHTLGAEAGGLGLVRGADNAYGFPDDAFTSFADEEDDEIQALMDAGAPAALAAQIAAAVPAAAAALAAAPPAPASSASSFGGRGRSGSYRDSPTGGTGFEGSPELPSNRRSDRGRSRGRGGGNGGSGGSTGAGTAGAGGGGGNAGW